MKTLEQLLDFVEETQFDRLGIFKYSEEEGTAAANMDEKVSEEEKERRWQEVMDLQATISQKKNKALIGTIQRVMIEDCRFGIRQTAGRTQAHAPEVDGVVFIQMQFGGISRRRSPEISSMSRLLML